jgi:hypothetical protein
MKIADFRRAAMEWTVTVEGADEFGEMQRMQLRIEKGFERLTSGEIGLSIDDGKRILSALQEFVVKQELATYALARRVCPSCERLRPVKDYTVRKIWTALACESKQLELGMPGDPLREFVVSEARIKRPPAILKLSSGVAAAADEGCRLVIISQRATLRSLKCGRGRCKLSSSKDIPDTEGSLFSLMARKS